MTRIRLSCVIFGLLANIAGGAAYAPDTPRFVLSSFQNSDFGKLFIGTSFNGRFYTPLGGLHVYETTDGTNIRDPSLLRYGGKWYVCHTSGEGLGFCNYFRILQSEDLVTWTPLGDVSMDAVPNTRFVWAPEWFVDADGSVHILVSTSFWWTDEHVIHELHPQTEGDFTSWSSPLRLHGPAFPEFPTTPLPGPARRVGAYDPFLVIRNGVYHLTYFDRQTTSISHATSPALLGPYAVVQTTGFAGLGSWMEGQTMLRLAGGIWRMTYADARTSTCYYVESSDDWQTWSLPQRLGSPDGLVFNHGTVIFNPGLPAFEMNISPADNGRFRISFPGIRENAYQVEWTEDLISWFPLGEAIEATGLPVEIEDAPPEGARIFYRTTWLPRAP